MCTSARVVPQSAALLLFPCDLSPQLQAQTRQHYREARWPHAGAVSPSDAAAVAGWRGPIAGFAAPKLQTPGRSDLDVLMWQAVSLPVNDVDKSVSGPLASFSDAWSQLLASRWQSICCHHA